jgi:hypothetical protein
MYNGITDYAAGNLLVDVEAVTGSYWPTKITAAVLVRAGLEALSAIVRVVGARAPASSNSLLRRFVTATRAWRTRAR